MSTAWVFWSLSGVLAVVSLGLGYLQASGALWRMARSFVVLVATEEELPNLIARWREDHVPEPEIERALKQKKQKAKTLIQIDGTHDQTNDAPAEESIPLEAEPEEGGKN